jgi:DNA-binding NarL/FixJ family response regulator
VADPRNLKLLVVEDDLQDEQLLCEALIEIEENRQWSIWRSASIVQVDQLSDALDCLRREHFDAVLLNLSLSDSPALLDTFLEANALARGAPIIVLADEQDENLAHRLLREGAEDVILKSELECGPLSRSVRYAIERRRRQDARTSPLADRATNVMSSEGFGSVAFHYAQLAFSLEIRLHLATVEIWNLPAETPEDREACELFLMRAADALQETLPAPALIGRVGKSRFAVILAGMSIQDAKSQVAHAAAEIEEVLSSLVSAGTRVSVVQLESMQSVEALLHDDETATAARWHTKTAMLAD